MKAALGICLLLLGCRGERLEWVIDKPVVECVGGRIVEERRTTDVVAGRTRNTVVRTNACLE